MTLTLTKKLKNSIEIKMTLILFIFGALDTIGALDALPVSQSSANSLCRQLRIISKFCNLAKYLLFGQIFFIWFVIPLPVPNSASAEAQLIPN